MSIQHKNIPDAELHEPKGAASALAGTAYIATGSGSGSWKKIQLAQCANLQASTSAPTTGITTSYKPINSTDMGVTVTWQSLLVSGMTSDTTAGYITIPDTGIYEFDITMGFVPATVSSVWNMTIGIDSGAGVVSQEASVIATRSTSGTSDTYQIVLNKLFSFVANQKVHVMIKEASGKELTITDLDFHMIRVV